MALTFAPGGDTALAVGAELRIVDTHTGAVVRTFEGLGGLFWGGFVRGGRWINAITGSGLVELFDVDSGSRLGLPLRVEDDVVTDNGIGALAGAGIYFGTVTGSVVFYVLEPDDWMTIACQAAGRNLTRAEWDHYLGDLDDYRATCPQYPAAT